jgi:hypothetical protein
MTSRLSTSDTSAKALSLRDLADWIVFVMNAITRLIERNDIASRFALSTTPE